MTDQEKFDTSRAAQQSGGPCPICDWRDGDGVRPCFSSREYGVVTHENSMKAAQQDMTPEQRSLVNLRQALVYLSREHLELAVWQFVDQSLVNDRERGVPPRSAAERETRVQALVRHLLARGLTSAGDPQYAGWRREEWWLPVEWSSGYVTPEALRGPTRKRTADGVMFNAYMAHVYEPHPGCPGHGHAVILEPYHIACTGCDTEVKLWEFGIASGEGEQARRAPHQTTGRRSARSHAPAAHGGGGI